MNHAFKRSLLFGIAGLMVSLPLGLASGQQQAMRSPDAQTKMPMPYAQGLPCAKRADVVQILRDKFGEGPVAQGLADTGAVAEVFISPKGTWTIVATSPNGLSCMVGSGQSWKPTVAHDDTI